MCVCVRYRIYADFYKNEEMKKPHNSSSSETALTFIGYSYIYISIYDGKIRAAAVKSICVKTEVVVVACVLGKNRVPVYI